MSTVSPSVGGASTEGALSGSIQWKIDKDKINNTNIYSQKIEVAGIPWALCLRRNVAPRQEYLACFFHRKDFDNVLRSVDATYAIKFVNHKEDASSILLKCEKTFDYDIGSWGSQSFVKWEDVIDEEKGFIKDDKFTIQVDFQLSNVQELRSFRRVDFNNSNEPSHDVVLLVDKKKFYTSKSYLSTLSRVFHSMFYGQFVEKDMKEIELKDINLLEFTELMKVIYPPHKKIIDDNFEYVLKLGDRFEIYMVIDNAEKFLINSTKLTVASKLLFSSRYRLHKLQNHCIDQLTTIKEVTDLKNSEDFKNFSDSVKAVLFDKIIKLSN